MKTKYILFITTLFAISVNAQIKIGKTNNLSSESVLVEFENDVTNTKGIILPSINNIKPSGYANGTFIYNLELNNVQVFENDVWKNLSDTRSSEIVPKTEDKAEGVIISTNTNTAQTNGVLVLDSETKAMVLPHIANPHLNVKGPYKGMICFDTVSKTMAIFDGVYWNYWK